MTERTLITEAGFSTRTLAVIRRAFPSDIATLGELKQAMTDNPLCRNLGKKTIGEIEAVLAETDTETDSTAVSETVESETSAETGFDYSLVDDDTAQYLRKATERIAQNLITIMSSQAEIGAILIEAHDRLANHYHGGFEKWYTSLGMSKSSVNRLIQVHEFRENLLRSSQLGQLTDSPIDFFDNLPKTLQADISSPSAPAEAVNAVLSGDITTHKDYIALKKQLEEAKNKADIISNNYDRLSKLNTRRFEDYEKEREKNKDLEQERDKLLSELKEAREQPKETVTIEADPTESRQYKALNKMNDSLKEEIENLKEQLRSSSTVTVPAGLDHDHLREFFEDLYGRADESFRDCCHFIKDDYPAETKEYVRKRVNELYDRFKTYIELNFKEEEPWL